MKIKFIFLAILSLFLLNSCLVSRKVTYFNNMNVDSLYKVSEIPTISIQKYDRLNILITSNPPELAALFNQDNASYSVNEKGQVNASTVQPSTTKGFLVDKEGNIEFPILGTIHVEGLTLEEVKSVLKGKLINEKYISNPSVKVELVNLKVMMMGEVGSVGILNIPDGNINLLEAIVRSGGLTNNATPNEITVIREENGNRKMYMNNIEDVNIFNSPTFHLKQNDIVYVRPKSATITPREDLSWRYFGMATGIITLGFTILALFKN